jgi:hypothetical protein
MAPLVRLVSARHYCHAFTRKGAGLFGMVSPGRPSGYVLRGIALAFLRWSVRGWRRSRTVGRLTLAQYGFDPLVRVSLMPPKKHFAHFFGCHKASESNPCHRPWRTASFGKGRVLWERVTGPSWP